MNLSSKFILPVIKRNQGVDILRSIALLGVIIAHCSPSDIILQIRQFDVPLMVVLSAISFSMSYKEGKEPWWMYCIKRAKRLIIPTWIFLTIYFMLFHESDIIVVLTSYLLIWGIGYVWIIRVFFAVAVFAPFMYKLCSKVEFSRFFWMGMIILMCINELVLIGCRDIINSSFIIKAIFVTIPYFLVYMVGLRIYKAKKSEIIVVATIFILLFMGQSFFLFVETGEFVPNHLYKYPPQIYYLSYALGISLLLYVLKDKIVKIIYSISSKLGDIMCWLAQHTLWIYFWHIVFVHISAGIDSFIIRFSTVLLGALLCTYLQCLILQIVYSHVKYARIKKNLRLLFEG